MRKMVWLAEDDHLQVETLVEMIRRYYPEIEVRVLNTEKEVRDAIHQSDAASAPVLILLDVMMRWCNPSANPDDMSVPNDLRDEVESEEYFGFKAGLRCAKLIVEKMPRVHVIIYTVLDEHELRPFLKDLPSSVTYLRKEPDETEIKEAIKRTLYPS